MRVEIKGRRIGIQVCDPQVIVVDDDVLRIRLHEMLVNSTSAADERESRRIKKMREMFKWLLLWGTENKF